VKRQPWPPTTPEARRGGAWGRRQRRRLRSRRALRHASVGTKSGIRASRKPASDRLAIRSMVSDDTTSPYSSASCRRSFGSGSEPALPASPPRGIRPPRWPRRRKGTPGQRFPHHRRSKAPNGDPHTPSSSDLRHATSDGPDARRSASRSTTGWAPIPTGRSSIHVNAASPIAPIALITAET